jgi:FkbM family methyltransferase
MKGKELKSPRLDVFEAAAKSDSRRNPIIHVGAHHGEEKEEYNQLGYVTVLWVEAQKTAFEILKNKVGYDYCIHGGLWSDSGLELDLHITNNSVSTSFYELDPKNQNFEAIKQVEVSKVRTITLIDAINLFKRRGVLKERFVLRLDVQGSEFAILKSSAHLLKHIDFICCEVTGRRQIYKNTQSRGKIVVFLLSKLWIPAFSRVNPQTSHGETIFIPLSRIIIFIKPIIYMRTISLIDNVRYHAGTAILKKLKP